MTRSDPNCSVLSNETGLVKVQHALSALAHAVARDTRKQDCLQYWVCWLLDSLYTVGDEDAALDLCIMRAITVADLFAVGSCSPRHIVDVSFKSSKQRSLCLRGRRRNQRTRLENIERSPASSAARGRPAWPRCDRGWKISHHLEQEYQGCSCLQHSRASFGETLRSRKQPGIP